MRTNWEYTEIPGDEISVLVYFIFSENLPRIYEEYKYWNLSLSIGSSLVRINQEYTEIKEAKILAYLVLWWISGYNF